MLKPKRHFRKTKMAYQGTSSKQRIRAVYTVGSNSKVINIHPEIVRQARIYERKAFEQRVLKDGSILLKPLDSKKRPLF